MNDDIIYVVAGNRDEACHYAEYLNRSAGQWVYVPGPNILRDRVINPTQVHYVGTWKGRPDKQAILDAVALSAYQE
jgi:hypothetical protein